ncbi:hypothetical protein B296_00013560 [Ensete ventricosum]|uniref:Hexosyltransferase n=1 Tax=Ensete ventricosum TaxID=4639 RepID=A0A427B8C3_ENSVE|nr:hypothetical protein B296_00013560 [Ensete ventricosum]
MPFSSLLAALATALPAASFSFGRPLSALEAAAVADLHPHLFREAPAFRNGPGCGSARTIHIATTLDAAYLRGSLAGVLSILRHSACPESTLFHFLANCPDRFRPPLAASFPSLSFVCPRPACIYLAGIFPRSVRRVIYFDSDRWNQHGLGGDNIEGLCRNLHPGPVSLLHWSGKGKPWLRLDAGRPCPIEALWAPYDLLHRECRNVRFRQQLAPLPGLRRRWRTHSRVGSAPGP